VRVEDWSGTFDADTYALTFTCTVRTADGDAVVRVAPFGSTDNRNPTTTWARVGTIAPRR
jgi:hypothetical protein